MGMYEENYLARRPQELCKMCGRCCRVSTTAIPYEELLKLQVEGDFAANEFLRIFEPYPSIDDARKIDAALVDNVINMLSLDGNFDIEKTTFYGCKYLRDDNLCGMYEQRPELCKHCPSTPWSIVPPGCGFEGWLFMEREKVKERIRRAKEELLELKLLKKNSFDEGIIAKICAVEEKLQGTIDMYKKYGSNDW